MSGICLIIVLYFPKDEQLKALLEMLRNEKVSVIFVDNTPEIVNNELLFLSKEENSVIIYLPQMINKGIAEAQNIGIVKAQNNPKFRYLIFLDQDSVIEKDFVKKMINEYLRIEKEGINIAALGPTIINIDKKEKYKQESSSVKQRKDGFYLPSALISSGMMISLETLNSVGLMESKLFIDAVDFEWCWRAKSKGYDCCMTEDVLIPHKVGIQDKSFFGYTILVSSPVRYYYQYRNFIWLLNRSYVPLNWKIKNFLKKIFLLFYLPFCTSDGIKNFTNSINGIKAGCQGALK
jgi:rhamnosyltransferase